MSENTKVTVIVSLVFGFFVGLAASSPAWGVAAFIFMVGFSDISFDLTDINEHLKECKESLKKIADKN